MPTHSPKGQRPVPVPRPEEVVEDYYEQLRTWAIGLTRGDTDVALDIVHDLYLYIRLAKPDFSRVENLDNYLYKCLRHIHLAHLSESSRNASQQVSPFEMDSLDFAFWANSETFVLEHQNDLRQICQYVVRRKAQTKSASLFILRFFHDYHLQAISEIANIALSIVQPSLSKVRSELQRYVENPGDPQFAGIDNDSLQWTSVSSPEFYRELRAAITQARTGDCLSENELLAPYSSPIPKAIPSSLLSHIVSCERCLAIIDRHFRRPTLGDRGPLGKIAGSAKRHRRISGYTLRAMSLKDLKGVVSRHYEDVYNHRPRILSIAVDGKIVASHNVEARRSMQSVRIEKPEQASGIEVFSQQDVRLMLVLLEDLPPHGPNVRAEHIGLSDGRWIELKLIFDSLGVNTEVTYFDPLFQPDTSASELDDEREAGVAPLQIVPRPPVEAQRLADQPLSAATDSADEALPLTVPPPGLPLIRRTKAWCSRQYSNTKRMLNLSMNPLLASAVLLAIASSMCFLIWMWKQPAMSPAALLDQAQRSERAAVTVNRPGVIYQKIAIRTPRRSVERTIYRDAQGIRRPRRLELSQEDEQLKHRLQSAGVDWDAPLSALDYAAWRHGSDATLDSVTRSGAHLLTLTTTPVLPGAVVKESLTIRDTDFHAVDRTVELRDSGTVEIAELNYDVLPWGAVNQDWFEPLSGGTVLPRRLHPSLLPHLPYVPSTEELDEAELSALLVLNHLDADQGEQIEVARNGSGIVVRGVVETEDRKREIESILNQVRYVTPIVFTFADMARKQEASGEEETTSIKTASAVRQPSPMELYLVPHGKSREDASQLARDLVDNALAVKRDSNETADLIRQFSSRDGLTPRAHDALVDLVANHRRDIASALDREEALLHEAGFVQSQMQAPAPPAGPSANLSGGADNNLALCRELASTAGTEARPAQTIAQEILAEIAHLRSVIRTMSIAPDLSNAAVERPLGSKNQ